MVDGEVIEGVTFFHPNSRRHLNKLSETQLRRDFGEFALLLVRADDEAILAASPTGDLVHLRSVFDRQFPFADDCPDDLTAPLVIEPGPKGSQSFIEQVKRTGIPGSGRQR